MAIPARSSRPDRPHPLVIKGEATENSAAENFSGLAMHAVDEIAAYRDLVEEGIDAQFGQPGYRNALAAQTCGLESGRWGSPLFCFRGWKTAARYPIEMATTERDRSRPSGNTCLRLNLDMASDRPQIYSYLVHEMIAFAVDLSNPAQLWLDGPVAPASNQHRQRHIPSCQSRKCCSRPPQLLARMPECLFLA